MLNELRQQCQCTYILSSITSAGIRCFPQSPTTVTFRAEISESPFLSKAELVRILETWVTSGDTVLVQDQELSLDDSCATIIDSFHGPECRPAITSDYILIIVTIPAMVLPLITAIMMLTSLLILLFKTKDATSIKPKPQSRE